MNLSSFRRIVSALQDLFFPPVCACCQAPLVAGEDILCLSCALQLPRTNFHQLSNNPVMEKFKGRIPVQKASSFLFFTKQGNTQKLIHQLKYKGRTEIGVFLGKLFAESLSANGWLKEINQIIPIPLHRRKERARGYNQSLYIAHGIAAQAKLPIVPKNTISKIRHTDSQTRKGSLERLKNVTDVFRLSRPELVRGKDILLIDDVITTGATLESCALEIIKTGRPRSLSIGTLAFASEL